MCRSIKQLRRAERDVTEDEIAAAALQYVRKVSGYRQPARANAPAFESAVAEVAAATRRLLVAVGGLPADPS
ncbi:DUF2277 domain-containing protein [Oscillochloris sp. ZM17-4]|uniref:DUF2277 domain-containing protein n=1 Tax=Oscillochloris sp. ZM17-4 TaxID=2866714 RepID=UPI001C73CCBB|nr:DUF2277 domain-containing protein [Oscillochloris sp. ZM17-4]MBX0331225.1 DUF2277 domain-containing protein [Oscillochloris sp. ZM17-4]